MRVGRRWQRPWRVPPRLLLDTVSAWKASTIIGLSLLLRSSRRHSASARTRPSFRLRRVSCCVRCLPAWRASRIDPAEVLRSDERPWLWAFNHLAGDELADDAFENATSL